MRVVYTVLLFTILSFPCKSQTPYQKDFQQFWEMIETEYAYFHQKQTDWKKVKTIYQPMADTITTREEFIQLLEYMIAELYDPHISLNTNLNSSFQLLPVNTDLWLAYREGRYWVTDVREQYSAEATGIHIGMEIIAVDGIEIQQAVNQLLPKSFTSPKPEVYEFFGNLVVAGNRQAKRVIKVSVNDKVKIYEVGRPRKMKPSLADKKLLTYQRLEGNIGYIKINNSLGNNDLIPLISQAVDSLAGTKSIILDLRETPSGGNTTVARAIMGKFTPKARIYQKHYYPWEVKTFGITRSWDEYVSPNGKIYTKKVIVLVGHWTGSVGEAIAIGLDPHKKAKIVGTKMAKLLGAIYCYRLNETNINVCFPAEQLFHVDGTPREAYLPKYLTPNSRATFEKGVKLAK